MAEGHQNITLSLAEESSINEFASPEARFECPICLSWLRDPVLTCCGHRFCRNCIQGWLLKENACPVDNMKLNKDSDIFPDNFTRREISQQKTKCPNIVRGCLVELSPLDVESHLLVCEYRIPELPDNEKLKCNFANVGCNKKFENESQRLEHLEQSIQQHLLLLSQKYTNVSVNDIQENASSTLAQGNFWDPPSKHDDKPSSSVNQNDNLQNVLRALYEKIVFLEQKSREQDIIIANMSEQLSNFQQTYCNGTYIWYFNDFSGKIKAMQEKPRTIHYSPPFFTSPNGYKMCIRINLCPRSPDHIALFLHVMKSGHDNTLEWPFTGKLSISIIHPNEPTLSIKDVMITPPNIEAFKQPTGDLNQKGFGYAEFALLNDLIKSGFVSNNQLIIKATASTI